jgi:hypothetical protein
LFYDPALSFNFPNLREHDYQGGIRDLREYIVRMNPNKEKEMDSDLIAVIFRLVLTMVKVRYFRCKLTANTSNEFYEINSATFKKIKEYEHKLYAKNTRINPYKVCHNLIKGFCRGYGAKYFSFLCEYKLLWLLPFWDAIKPCYNDATYTNIIEQLKKIDQKILRGEINYHKTFDELAGQVFALLLKPYVQQHPNYIKALEPFRKWLSYYRGDNVYNNILKNLPDQPNLAAAHQQYYSNFY